MYWVSERPDLIARGSDGISGPLTGGSNSLAPLGMGLSVPGGAMFGSAPTYSYPAAAGSIFGFVTASFSPTDSLAHKVVAGNAPESTLSYIELQKADDNNWYFGWFGSSDTRVSAAATGTYSAGDSFVVGGTWTTAGGTNLYVKGKLLANNPTAPNTSGFPFGNNFSIGSNVSLAEQWVTTAYRDAIYWVGIWDRALTNAEIQSLSADPFQFLIFREDYISAQLLGTSPVYVDVNANRTVVARPRNFRDLAETIVVPVAAATVAVGGYLDAPQIPRRSRAARGQYDPFPVGIPFVAPTPTQYGWELPQQIARTRDRPTRLEYDPGFVPPPPTPTQFGAELPTQIARKRGIPARLDYEIGFIPIALTPTQFGAELPTQVARTRGRPARLEYEPGYVSPPPTPSQFGAELPTQIARTRGRPTRLEYDPGFVQVPPTPTPTQFGAELPIHTARPRSRPFRLEYDPGFPQVPPVSTPSIIGWSDLASFVRPRQRSRRIEDNPQRPIAVAVTPSQFGAEALVLFPRRRARPRRSETDVFLPEASVPPTPTPSIWGYVEEYGHARVGRSVAQALGFTALSDGGAGGGFPPSPPPPVPGPPPRFGTRDRLSVVPIPSTPITDPSRGFALTRVWYQYFLSLPPSERYVFLGNMTSYDLPDGGVVGDRIGVKDNAGNAGIFPRTIFGAIDGSPTFVLNQNYQAVEFVWNGTHWSVFRGQ
jgi:hypothetical protein